ncbi:MAG: hypothetical protein V1874_06810 [Spirochaetota bacterium]
MNDIFGINSNEKFYEGNFGDDESKDNYYDELEHEEEKDEDAEKELEEDEEETKVHLSFACDDCDYRWDDIVIDNKDNIEREEFDIACPMCGSIAITQI